MNRNKQIHLLILLILITISIAVSAPAGTPQDIYVLLAIDNGNAKTGSQHMVDKDRIEVLMANRVVSTLKKERLGTTISIDELLSNDRELTAASILDWLRRVNPEPDDVVFVYFSGHGGADKTGAQERFLLLEDGKTYRKEIVKAMEALNCQLKILITDTDSTGPPTAKPKRATNTRRYVGLSTHATLTETDVLRQLFFEHKGFLNLTATSLGHSALADGSHGGWFTMALMRAMFSADLSKVDRNPQDGFVSWEEVFELTKEYLHEHYQVDESNFPPRMKERLERLNQTTQTPEVLSDFPKRIH